MFNKRNFPPRVFSCFLYCTNDTKSRKTSQMIWGKPKKIMENTISRVFPLSLGLFGTFYTTETRLFLRIGKKTPEKSNKKNILHHLMAANTLKSTHDNKLFHRLDKVDFLCNFTMLQKYSLWVVQEIFWLFETVQSCVEKYGTKGLQRQMGSHKTYQKMMSSLTWILAPYLTVEQISCSFSQTGV